MIKIICDTTSCLNLAKANEIGIGFIPQIIVIGEETYRDDTEMDPIAFLKRQKNSPVLPKTAAPPPAMYHPLYQKYLDEGATIFVLTPSAEVSGTYRSATVAAQDFPGKDIRIIDTRLIASGLASVVFQSLDWINSGMDADTLEKKIKDYCLMCHTYFAIDTLEYLYKGGRIGAASALIGSLLQMKPLLSFQNGHIEPLGNQRTHKRAIARLIEMVVEQCPKDGSGRISIMHGDAFEEAKSIAVELAEKLGVQPADIPIFDLTPAILVHSGPGVIGVSFFA
ncbi:MAG TPA: DegV family protein [Anaerolineaceae bacterium]